MATTKDLAIVCNDIYNAPGTKIENPERRIGGTDWYLEADSYYESENTGFQAGVYIKKENGKIVERIIAYAGTNDIEDADDDAAIGTGGIIQQGEQALAFFDRNNEDGSISMVTGHSLGDALIGIVSDARGVNAVGFNGPGTEGIQYIDPDTKEVRTLQSSPDLRERFTEYLIKGDKINESGTTHVGRECWYNPISTAEQLLDAVKEAINRGEEVSSTNPLQNLLNNIFDPHKLMQQ